VGHLTDIKRAPTGAATAADIIAFVKALGLKAVDLFGFSIGGMVAQQLALDAPELVRRILLVGTGPSAGEGMQVFSGEVMDTLVDRTAPFRNAAWTCSFRKARRATPRARPGSSGSPRENWTANQNRNPRSPRPSSPLWLNGVRSPQQTATAI
jgi:pimeloyl-ACP methyl ester carboxylesterase